MNSFVYYNPTRIVFGRHTIPELPELLPPAATIMMTYGGGSIKRNGVYGQVLEALAPRKVIEFGGIPANPTYEVCMEAVALGRREGISFLLAVGGGSVIDGTKFIAAAIPFTADDPWIFLEQRGVVMPAAAIPIGVVLTLPATGSEMNKFCVLSKAATREKRAFDSERLHPRFSILDPETTFSLPGNQVRNGIVDAFAHVVEQYMNTPLNTPLQDRQAEAVFNTLVEQGPKTLADPTDYEARANFMWSATSAFNGHLACGVIQDWSTHHIGHELTAFYGIAHAESLAVLMPARWRLDLDRKRAKLTQFSRRVWGWKGAEHKAAEVAVDKTVEFFHSLGMPTQLRDYGIAAEEAARRIGERYRKRGTKSGEYKDLDGDAVAEIVRACA